jgi:hypothetical protein
MSTTADDRVFTPVIEPHTQKWLDELAAAVADQPPLYELEPKDAREVLVDPFPPPATPSRAP